MYIEVIVIKSKVRQFIVNNFDGFYEFKNSDNLFDMGIVTEDFVFSLIEFFENEFNITISVDDFNLNELSVNSIEKKTGSGNLLAITSLMIVLEFFL